MTDWIIILAGSNFLVFYVRIIEGEETEEKEEEKKKEEDEKYMKYPRSLTLLNNILILTQQHFLIKVNEKFLREFIAHLYILHRTFYIVQNFNRRTSKHYIVRVILFYKKFLYKFQCAGESKIW